MVIEICNEKWNTSNLQAYRPILVILMLYHSKGCGSPFDTATPSFMTISRSSIIGLSNEVSLVSESCVVPERVVSLKVFAQSLPYEDIGPPVYMSLLIN